MRGKAEIRKLLADVQLRDESTVALDVLLGEVVEHAAALADELVVKSKMLPVCFFLVTNGQRFSDIDRNRLFDDNLFAVLYVNTGTRSNSIRQSDPHQCVYCR